MMLAMCNLAEMGGIGRTLTSLQDLRVICHPDRPELTVFSISARASDLRFLEENRRISWDIGLAYATDMSVSLYSVGGRILPLWWIPRDHPSRHTVRILFWRRRGGPQLFKKTGNIRPPRGYNDIHKQQTLAEPWERVQKRHFES